MKQTVSLLLLLCTAMLVSAAAKDDKQALIAHMQTHYYYEELLSRLPDSSDEYDKGVVYRSVQYGDKKGLALALKLPECRQRIDTVSDGLTALAMSAERGFTEFVEILLEYGADQTKGKYLPLHAALSLYGKESMPSIPVQDWLKLVKALISAPKARETILTISQSSYSRSPGSTAIEIARMSLSKSRSGKIREELTELITTMEQIRDGHPCLQNILIKAIQ